MGQFNGKRGNAEQGYRQFVSWGIGKPTIWTEVRGQTLLGEEGFVDRFVDHLKKHEDIPEILRSQRYVERPSLEQLLNEKTVRNKMKRNKAIGYAVEKHGYRQREVADHLGMYFISISRIVNAKK